MFKPEKNDGSLKESANPLNQGMPTGTALSESTQSWETARHIRAEKFIIPSNCEEKAFERVVCFLKAEAGTSDPYLLVINDCRTLTEVFESVFGIQPLKRDGGGISSIISSGKVKPERDLLLLKVFQVIAPYVQTGSKIQIILPRTVYWVTWDCVFINGYLKATRNINGIGLVESRASDRSMDTSFSSIRGRRTRPIPMSARLSASVN